MPASVVWFVATRPRCPVLTACLVIAGLVDVAGLTTLPADAALARTQLAVVVNAADPQSVEIGEYYARQRGIPRGNVVAVTLPVGKGEITRKEFESAKAQLDAHIPAEVQALALAWTTPFRVDCLSITTAFAFGFDPAFCAEGCRPTRPSKYFNSNSRAPFGDLGLRPAMLLAGTSLARVRALIDRGVASDGTFPSGTAYLLSTSDRARNTRATHYPLVDKLGLPLRVEHLQADELRDRQDVLFYFLGLGKVSGLETLRFLPGAVADHLTSTGGVLNGHEQMSALRWIEAGATGSYGAVAEPCNFPTKFPFPAVLIARYMTGETLIEAYWKSVAWPGQGLFIGEPLAAPFRARSR
jgi:uncharacterized protein (TIGR03790 family)